MCHKEQYESWLQTDHANSAGIHEINESGVWYWVAFPSRVMNEEAFLTGCASCHVVGWDAETQSWPEKNTDPGKFLNIQCEICHGPGMESMTVDYSPDLCARCHNQPKDLEKSAHSESVEDLLSSSHAKDSCLRCMSTQGFLGKEVTVETEGLSSISCAACHDPHSVENEYQLRYEAPTELCSQCHVGSHHPQAEMFPDSPHDKAGLECTSCHGQGTRLFHGKESAWFNHTFGIFNTYYPYNQTEPMVCSQCHDQTWATAQLGVIQSLTVDFIANATEVIDSAQASMEDASSVSGISQADIDDATAMIEEAENVVDYLINDASGGLHNPEKTYALLGWASHLASGAESKVLKSKADALSGQVATLESEKTALSEQVSSLQSQVSSLQADVSDLQGKVEGLSSQLSSGRTTNIGIGAIVGLVIGAAAVFFLKKRT